MNQCRANEETECVHGRPGNVWDLNAVGIAVAKPEEQHGAGDDRRRDPSFTGNRGSNEHDREGDSGLDDGLAERSLKTAEEGSLLELPGGRDTLESVSDLDAEASGDEHPGDRPDCSTADH